MNITLSADKETIEKAREYAKRHRSTLNNLIRTYLQRLAEDLDAQSAAEEFEHLCQDHAGMSPDGYRFDRSELYERHETR